MHSIRDYFILFLNLNFVVFAKCENEDAVLCKGCPGIIVDTDCGGDDAMAIALLLKAEAEGRTSSWGKIVGFTTVSGNTGAINVTRNVKALKKVLGRSEIPVYRGIEDQTKLSTFFGTDGLGDFLPPAKYEPILPNDTIPGLYLASMVHRYPNQVTILCIGALTNLAMALFFNPEFFSDVKHIVILGGDYRGEGNVAPGIEANMNYNPDAANIFFQKIPPSVYYKVTLLPLEAILDAIFPMTFRTNELGEYNNTVMDFLNKAERLSLPKYGDKWPSYDPTAASVLLDPSLVAHKAPAWVEVDVNPGSRGAMFVSFKGKSFNVDIITKIDQDRLRNVLKHYLASTA